MITSILRKTHPWRYSLDTTPRASHRRLVRQLTSLVLCPSVPPKGILAAAVRLSSSECGTLARQAPRSTSQGFISEVQRGRGPEKVRLRRPKWWQSSSDGGQRSDDPIC